MDDFDLYDDFFGYTNQQKPKEKPGKERLQNKYPYLCIMVPDCQYLHNQARNEDEQLMDQNYQDVLI